MNEVKALQHGLAVKFVSDYVVSGRAVVFGGRDLVGDIFTKETDFGLGRSLVGMPIYWDHAMGGIKSQIGQTIDYRITDEGIDIVIELNKHHKYIKEITELIEAGVVGLSTGAPAHLVMRKSIDIGEWIQRWPLSEGSLTVHPAEPRTLGVKSEESTASSHADATLEPDDTHQTIISKESDTMSDIKDAVKQAITELAGEPVQGGVIAAPSTKTVTSRGFSNEPKEAFKHWIRTGDDVAAKATLVEGTNDNGGYLVPKDFYDMIIGRRDELSLLSQARFMRLTTSRRQIDVPAQDAKSDFAVVAESGSANFDEPTFANTKTITVYNHSLAMKVSNELLRDQAANLEQFLTEEIGRAAARATNNAIIAGTGSSQPYGILARATVSETLASTTGVDFADIINIMGKLPSWYDEQGATGWIMRNATKAAIRALTGNYPQFRPLETGGTGDLEGYPVMVSDKIDAMGASAKSIIFGNMSYYAFVENGALEVSRNPYLYQANYQTGIFVNYRFGGDVTQPEAFVYGVHPAA
jgi:HK97 family phage major capsid protein